MDVAAIRQGMADTITVGGLTAYPTIIEKPEPPCVLVLPAQPFIVPESMARGQFSLYFRVLILAASSVDDVAQTALDGYLNTSGSDSVLAALETSPRTLGGYASDIRVQEVTTYGDVTWNDISFWGAELQVRVLATG